MTVNNDDASPRRYALDNNSLVGDQEAAVSVRLPIEVRAVTKF